MIFLILTHQLFDIKLIKNVIKNMEIIIWEHPHYFTGYNYNMKKLILHRASMKYYFDMLKNKIKNKIRYIEYNEKFNITEYVLFDPIDIIKLPSNYTMIESPNFILTKEQYKKYQNKTKNYIFNNFYLWCKDEINLYPELKSLDKMNRVKYSSKLEKLKIPSIPRLSKVDKMYIDSAKIYIVKHFPNNCGNIMNFNYPITHKTARKWLNHFINTKLKNFGSYQDVVITSNTTLFHSILSSSINIGLINPNEIIMELKKVKSKIPINSFEGYLRQLFWREYQRYCYIYVNFNKNYFGNKKKLTKSWYDGTLGITPIDNMIRLGFDTGYLHHIVRLMFIGNYMNLSSISPTEGYKWFMEFSIDSYCWVMNQNVLDMVFFVTGGKTMRRPYISSSNYILKMSNFKKDKWSDEWDNLYNKFIKKNKKKLWAFRYYFSQL